ncbi:MAG: hypothetical protein IKQ41_05955 [Clostridia bacterium]|nr:hypothetical protein [Clostridia bacterium]
MKQASFAKAAPAYILWNGVQVSTAFPYLQVLLQGRPRHGRDEFTLRHPRMEQGQRAKIFAPFDALDGYGGSIGEKNIAYMEKIELDESEREEINRKLLALRELTRTRRLARENNVQAAVTYFVLCQDRHSLAYRRLGRYATVSGRVSKVDGEITRTITVEDTAIPFDNILLIAQEEK